MPSTAPDVRMATARGFWSSRSARLGEVPPASRADESTFGSGLNSPAGGLFGNFPSAGHMASKLAVWSGRACGGGPESTGGGGERQPPIDSRLLSPMPDPLLPNREAAAREARAPAFFAPT